MFNTAIFCYAPLILLASFKGNMQMVTHPLYGLLTCFTLLHVLCSNMYMEHSKLMEMRQSIQN